MNVFGKMASDLKKEVKKPCMFVKVNINYLIALSNFFTREQMVVWLKDKHGLEYLPNTLSKYISLYKKNAIDEQVASCLVEIRTQLTNWESDTLPEQPIIKTPPLATNEQQRSATILNDGVSKAALISNFEAAIIRTKRVPISPELQSLIRSHLADKDGFDKTDIEQVFTQYKNKNN